MFKLSDEALVLEVGSGSSPWTRADVLLDRFYVDETGQRGGTPIFRDRRPMVVAAGERLPFKDKAFDFVYSCHVIEHAEDIASMLREMSRVARAGFIECPNPLLERILDQDQHNWYVTKVGGKLLVARKTNTTNVSLREDRFYFHMISDHFIVRHNWEQFVTRLHWTDAIDFVVCNDVKQVFDEHPIEHRFLGSSPLAAERVLRKAWFDAIFESTIRFVGSLPGSSLLKRARRSARAWSANRQPPRVDEGRFQQLLACPYCRANLVKKNAKHECVGCGKEFQHTHGVAVLL